MGAVLFSAAAAGGCAADSVAAHVRVRVRVQEAVRKRLFGVLCLIARWEPRIGTHGA